MRAHNHLEVKTQCREAIPKLMKLFNLGMASTIRTDELGWVNPVFFINEKYVFRFNARDINLPKLQREKVAIDLLAKAQLPVPNVIAIDDSKSISPFDVIITEKIDGFNVESEWPKLDIEQRHSLAEQAGGLLKLAHGVKFELFGDLSKSSPLPQTNTWIEFLKSKIQFHLAEAEPYSLFSPQEIDNLWANLNSFERNLSSVNVPHFVHVDYHFGNILHKNTKIVGVLDFEWSFAGDPLYDLCSWSSMDQTWPDSQSQFLKGYGRENFSEDELHRMKLYQMIRNIELCVVAKKHFSIEEADDYLKTTLRQMASLERLS